MIVAMVAPPWDVSDVELADTVVVDVPPVHVAAAPARRSEPAVRRPGPSAAYLERIAAAGRAMRGRR